MSLLTLACALPTALHPPMTGMGSGWVEVGGGHHNPDHSRSRVDRACSFGNRKQELRSPCLKGQLRLHNLLGEGLIVPIQCLRHRFLHGPQFRKASSCQTSLPRLHFFMARLQCSSIQSVLTKPANQSLTKACGMTCIAGRWDAKESLPKEHRLSAAVAVSMHDSTAAQIVDSCQAAAAFQHSFSECEKRVDILTAS